MQPKIILLSGKGKFAPFVYNGLSAVYTVEKVILEDEVDYKQLLNRRRKKLGYIHVAGQQLFNKYTVKKLMQTSKARIKEIIQHHHLQGTPIPNDKIIQVHSVNDLSTINIIQRLQPNMVIVNGTRILSKALLQSVPAYFMNLHGGITPKYRGGGAGAYWALVNGEPHQCGSTVHVVDEGIDTGAILFQDTIQPTEKDNYITYVFLNVAKEIELVKKAIASIVAGNLQPVKPQGTSRVWYEPAIWQYWYYRLLKKVK